MRTDPQPGSPRRGLLAGAVDSFFMGRFERFRNLPGVVEGRINRQRAILLRAADPAASRPFPRSTREWR
jgi:hypothetical protein